MPSLLRKPARLDVYPVCITLACDVVAPWCGCRGPGGPSWSPGENVPADLALDGKRPIVVRLVGGDPIRYGDLAGWARWAHAIPRARVEVEAPAHGLVRDPEALGRLREARPDRVRAILHGADDAEVERWTGVPRLATDGFAGLEAALAAELEVQCVLPVNATTVASLERTVRAVAERFGDRVPIVLRRAPATGEAPWAELPALAEVLAALPPELPGGAPLWLDDGGGWGACVVPRAAWRPELIPVAPTLGDRPADRDPDAELCGACAFRRQCAWRVHGPAPRDRMRPLDADAARFLQSLGSEVEVAGATHERVDRKAFDLPELLCFAPWTTMTLYSRGHHPVPCAPAWVDTKLTWRETARELRESLLRVAWKDSTSRLLRRQPRYDVGNEEWPLPEMWNGAMYRQMRREMAPGGPSHRCRASCRVILGVEERGTNFFTLPEGDLAPTVAANRRRLLDEIRAGKSELSSTPLELTVGVSAHCNFTCGFCSGPQGQYGELSERRLAEVLAWLPGLMQLTVVGPGEPLMSVTFKRLLEHIATVGYPSLTVSLTTNGTLARPAWVERHAAVRWGQIRFSINAGSAATHERMTGKQLFGQLLENVEAVAALRERTRPPFTFALSCVLSDFILGDLHRYAEIVDRYRAVPILEPMTGNMNGLSPYLDEGKTRRLMEECASVARDYQHKNPQLHHAFEAMARFAEQRLAAGELGALPQR